MHARCDFEAHLFDQDITIWWEDRNVFENNFLRSCNLSTSSDTLYQFLVFLILIILRDHDSLVFAIGKIVQYFVHLIDQRRVTSQVLHFFIWNHNPSNCFSKVDQEWWVSHVVPRNLSLVISILCQVFLTFWTEDWQSDNCVPNHDSTILDKHWVINSHQESLSQYIVDMWIKPVETTIDVLSLPLGTLVESNFLGVRKQFSVKWSILAFKLLLCCCQSSEWWRNHLN